MVISMELKRQIIDKLEQGYAMQSHNFYDIYYSEAEGFN